MTKVKVKPGDGLLVRKENGGFLADAGELVELTTYVRRRLRDGDMVMVESKKTQSKKRG